MVQFHLYFIDIAAIAFVVYAILLIVALNRKVYWKSKCKIDTKCLEAYIEKLERERKDLGDANDLLIKQHDTEFDEHRKRLVQLHTQIDQRNETIEKLEGEYSAMLSIKEGAEARLRKLQNKVTALHFAIKMYKVTPSDFPALYKDVHDILKEK